MGINPREKLSGLIKLNQYPIDGQSNGDYTKGLQIMNVKLLSDIRIAK